MTVTWNPNEPLFDQTTFDFVEVDGDVVMPEDDAAAITNAAWYRVLTQRGDCPRDRSAGIDRGMVLFNPELPVTEGIGAVRSQIMTTPGISSVTDLVIVGYDAAARAVYLAYTAETVLGEQLSNTLLLQG